MLHYLKYNAGACGFKDLMSYFGGNFLIVNLKNALSYIYKIIRPTDR